LTHKHPTRFAVGANVRVRNPGINGVVLELDDEPTVLGEYWHKIQTRHGERKEPGCNLELIPAPAGTGQEGLSKAAAGGRPGVSRTRGRTSIMKEHEYALFLAARGKLPENIGGSSRPSVTVIGELVDAGLIKAIDASSMDGPAYLNSQITLTGREYLANLRKEADHTIVVETNKTGAGMGKDLSQSPRVWSEIQAEYDMSKKQLGKRISFVKDEFKRKVIFRDIEQAFWLAQNGFNKPSVILAGGVVEELLRLFLEHKNLKPEINSLDSYIKCCEKHGFIKDAIHNLADSVRQFRNIVHLEKEKSAKRSISKATAKGAVSSIFTIANELSG